MNIKNVYNQMTAIKKTLEWYSNFHIKKVNPKILCDNEIKNYENENI